MQSKRILRVVDGDIESPYKIVSDIFDLLKIKLWTLLYHSPNTTWRLPWCLLCDVIWAPPECSTTSESLYDVIEEL